MSKMPDTKVTEVFKLAAVKWGEMTDDQKETYNDMQKVDKQVYAERMA